MQSCIFYLEMADVDVKVKIKYAYLVMSRILVITDLISPGSYGSLFSVSPCSKCFKMDNERQKILWYEVKIRPLFKTRFVG